MGLRCADINPASGKWWSAPGPPTDAGLKFAGQPSVFDNITLSGHIDADNGLVPLKRACPTKRPSSGSRTDSRSLPRHHGDLVLRISAPPSPSPLRTTPMSNQHPNPEVAVFHSPFGYRLSQFSERFNAAGPVKNVAIGASSTAGEGGVAPYPCRLELVLRDEHSWPAGADKFKKRMIDVINRG